MQEAARKDVERAFGVLQARFTILANPARFWYTDDLANVMRACIILHNMIVEDERDFPLPMEYHTVSNVSISPLLEPTDDSFASFANRFRDIRNPVTSHYLRSDLIEHLWQRKGNQE